MARRVTAALDGQSRRSAEEQAPGNQMPRRYRSGQRMVSTAVRVHRVRTSGVSHESCCCDPDVCNVVQPKPARCWYPRNDICRQHGAQVQ